MNAIKKWYLIAMFYPTTIFTQPLTKVTTLYIDPPQLSQMSGFYNQPFTLSVDQIESLPVYFTKNTCALPIRTGILWQNSLQIASRIGDTNVYSTIKTNSGISEFKPPRNEVFKATVIRAQTRTGSDTSRIVTRSYFVGNGVKQRYKLPVISLVTDSLNFFQYDSGIYIAGRGYYESLKPDALKWTDGNFNQRGDAWERDVHVEYFDEDKNLRIDQDARVRIHGGGTRQYSQKSLRLYAKGSIAKFYFPLFSQKPYRQYDRVILRNAGNDHRGVFFRDAFTQLLTQHLNVTTQGYKPVVVFLNGEYWGLHELRERYDDEYFEYHYGIAKDSIDLLENNMAVEDGDSLHYLNLINYLKNNDITQPAVYNYVTTQMDIENYIDYVIVEVYTDNGDWPGNNSMFWRKRTSGYQSNALYGHDGRWRWSLQDLDFSFGLYNSKSYTTRTLEIAIEAGGTEWPNPDWSTFLLRTLMKNHTFSRAFHIRFADQINTTFIPERVISLVDSIEQLLDYDMAEHIARWRNPTSKDRWYAEIDTIRTWAALRPENMRSQLASYFSLPGMYTFTCNINLPQSATLKVNTIDINDQTAGIPNPQQPFPWTGTYFLQVPLTIHAQPQSGYTFKYWQIENDQIFNNPFTFTPRDYVYAEAVFEKWPVTNPNVSDLSLRIWPNPATEQIQVDLSAFAGQKVAIILYTVTGQPVERLYDGMISDLDSSKTFTISQLPTGVYLIVISTPSYRQTIKLVKM